MPKVEEKEISLDLSIASSRLKDYQYYVICSFADLSTVFCR